MKEKVQTNEQFYCRECKHRGPALGTVFEEHHPYGMGYATEYLMGDDLECAKCGSPHVTESDEDNHD